MGQFLYAPTILFLTVVAPIWLIMHYRYKSKMIKGISEQELNNIDEMLAKIDTLSERIETLEEILDKEHGHWRSTYEGTSQGAGKPGHSNQNPKRG